MKTMKNIAYYFLQRNFIFFVMIGVLNTIIHLLVYNVFNIIVYATISNTVAFILSSIFSYWANSKFTYNRKMSYYTFNMVAITFLFKLILSNALEFIFRISFLYLLLTHLLPFIPIFITIILTPLQFVIFNKIFFENKLQKEILHYKEIK
ncbi:MAG: GtrA family protein [bacterium]